MMPLVPDITVPLLVARVFRALFNDRIFVSTRRSPSPVPIILPTLSEMKKIFSFIFLIFHSYMPMPNLSLKLGCSSPQVQLVWPGYIFRKETKKSHQVYILLYFTLICQLDLIENRKQLLIFTKIVRAPAWFVSLGVSLNIRRNQPGMKFTNSIFLNHNKVMLRRPATSQ